MQADLIDMTRSPCNTPFQAFDKRGDQLQYHYVLVLKEMSSSKFIVVEPLISKKAQEVASAILKMLGWFGYGKTFLVDNGTEFQSKV